MRGDAMSLDKNSDMIVAYLNMTGARLASVSAVEVNLEQTRIKLSPRGSAPDVYALNPALFDALADLVNQYPQASGVVALPDWILDFNGVVLSSCRLIISNLGPQNRRAMLRIQRAEGALGVLFGESLHRLVSAKGLDPETTIRLFEDIFLPLYNLSFEIDAMARELPEDDRWKIRNFFHCMQLRLAPFTAHYPELAAILKREDDPGALLLLE